MTSQRTEEEQKRQIVNRRHFSFRLNLFFFSTFFLFSVLIVQLAILQFVKGPELKEQETSLGSRPVQIPPIRGDIYDSSGRKIAYSTATQSIYYTIETGVKEEDAVALAKKLNEVFVKYGDPKEAMTVEDIVKQMDITFRLNSVYTPRRIKSNLTNREISYFMENREQFQGIEVVEDSIRNYDKETVAVQLVGYLKKFKSAVTSPVTQDFYEKKAESKDPTLQYLNEEDVGMDGLEYMYQDLLRGKNGVKRYPVNSLDRIIGPPVITKPQKGNDIYMTINRAVQLRAEKAIVDHINYIRNAPESTADRAEQARAGYAVAMEVKTGKVIAMASMPDYDPNLWRGGRISPEDYANIQSIQNNGTIREVYQKWPTQEEANKHPSSLVYLGSTQKPLTVLVGLAEKLITPNTFYNDTGVFSFGREGRYRVSIRNSQNRAYGRMDPSLAIEKSSNPFMAEMIGNQLYRKYKGNEGVKVWDKYVKQFGLGVVTGSGLLGESKGVVDYFYEAENASAQSALIRSSFGQQARYTPLQLVQYAATLANRGKRMKPIFVNKIVDPNGNVIEQPKPEVLNTVELPEAYWQEIERGMKSGVQGFEGVNYTFNRKTGTSQQTTSAGDVENAVFISYAPAENPVLAVAVVVPEGGYGGRGAAPIARQIFDAYDEEIGLYGKPRKASSAGEPETAAPATPAAPAAAGTADAAAGAAAGTAAQAR